MIQLNVNGAEQSFDGEPEMPLLWYLRDVFGADRIKSQRAENEQLLVSISDTGVGLPRQQTDQIFNAFFTTKPYCTGMGLRTSRSIIESHGGRLWAADNSPRRASFCFTLPTKAEACE